MYAFGEASGSLISQSACLCCCAGSHVERVCVGGHRMRHDALTGEMRIADPGPIYRTLQDIY
jgi:hypothetical protein